MNKDSLLSSIKSIVVTHSFLLYFCKIVFGGMKESAVCVSLCLVNPTSPNRRTNTDETFYSSSIQAEDVL